MRISRIQIKNFRNFKNLDVRVGEHAVILGENKVGKTNLLFALRLILDPTLPDSARKLRIEDFWDGISGDLKTEHSIEVSLDFRDFENDENLLAVLADHLVKVDPMVARITYRYQPIPGLEGDPKSESDFEFVIFGGGRPDNSVGYEIRRWMPMDLFPALRDAESDLARWSRSPLRPLLDRAAKDIDPDTLNEIAEEVEATTDRIAEIDELKGVVGEINEQLETMVGSTHSIETALGFAPTDPEKLIRALQMMIDGGNRSVSEASLGSANVLYLALKQLEHQRLVDEGDRQHTFLAIEEPEAHLHPHVQRKIYRNYLQARDEGKRGDGDRSILLTTHSPNVASVAPLKNVVVLRQEPRSDHTVGKSLCKVDLTNEELEDLERYLDVTRGELFFSRAVILVEGDAERFLIPTLARLHDDFWDFDALGVTVCSIGGTNFAPFLKLLGPDGLDVPVVVLTDFDPKGETVSQEDADPDDEGTEDGYGNNRVVNQILGLLMNEDEWNAKSFEAVLALAPQYGAFVNEYTFEVDLFRSAAEDEFQQAVDALTTNQKMKDRFADLAADPASMNPEQLLKDINSIGKGRFAQRLSAVLMENDVDVCPQYIAAALEHLKGRL